jgi:hypothetical protein
VRRLAFDELHDTAWRNVRRDAQQQVHVVGSHVALQDLDVVRFADLPDQVAHPDADAPPQDRLAVLRHEHEMKMQLVDGVRPLAVLHAPQAS